MSIRNELLQQISSATFDIRNNATIAGYGGIAVKTDEPLGAISATPTVLTGFDAPIISTPRGVVYNIPNNSLAINARGVWTALLRVSLSFDDSNAGRRIALRLLDATNNTPSATEFTFFVGRNTDGANLTVAVPFEITAAAEGDEFQIQILSSTDTFTNAVCVGASYSFTNNSPITELLQ